MRKGKRSGLKFERESTELNKLRAVLEAKVNDEKSEQPTSEKTLGNLVMDLKRSNERISSFSNLKMKFEDGNIVEVDSKGEEIARQGMLPRQQDVREAS